MVLWAAMSGYKLYMPGFLNPGTSIHGKNLMENL